MNCLQLKEVTKRFGGLVAVKGVSFEMLQSQIVGLIGPNGAGKTTIFNLITGNYELNGGQIFFFDQIISGLPTYRIVELGIARTFQTIRLFKNLSALENVLAGCHCRMTSGLFSSMFHTRKHKMQENQAIDNAMHALAFVGLSDHHDQKAKNFSYGNQRLLEIARAMATSPKLIILDEPAGGMNEQETLSLIQLIKKIQAQGISVLLIEHDMRLVMRVCENIVVVDYGQKIAEGTPEKIKNNSKVIKAYLGSDMDSETNPVMNNF
jgi:branched-chain amino acid transport system ATP-binding protein